MIGTQFDVWADIPNTFGLPDVGIPGNVPNYSGREFGSSLMNVTMAYVYV